MRICAGAVIALTVAMTSPVRAEPAAQAEGAVALLPLDAEPKQLEIYGQPVASEIARALVAGNVDVVVVGPGMKVPERARLIVDGRIARKGAGVVLSLRVREPAISKPLDQLSANASSLANIDGAAAELSAKIVPVVQARLAERARPRPVDRGSGEPAKPPVVAAPALHKLVFAIGGAPPSDLLHAALAQAFAPWAKRNHHDVSDGDASALLGTKVNDALAGDIELAIALELREFVVEPGPVPMARARVRLRIVERAVEGDPRHGVLFDRVIVTDTIVGERGMSNAAMATRAAREVLAIAAPHVRRLVPAWR